MAFTGAWGQWYEEAEHPRGPGGKWRTKGGGGESRISDERARVDLNTFENRQPDSLKTIEQLTSGPENSKDIADYTSYSFAMNNELRAGEPPGEQAERLFGEFRKSGNRLSKSIQVWRAVSSEKEAFGKKLAVGDSYVDRGFMSTSGTFGAAERFINNIYVPGSRKADAVILKIEAPAGLTAVRGDSMESEVIFPPETRVKITGFEGINLRHGRQLIVKAELEQPAGYSKPATEGKVYLLPTQRAKEARPPEPPKPKNVFVEKWHERGIFAPLKEDEFEPVRYAKSWVENRPSDELLAESAEGLATLGDEDGQEHGVLIQAGKKDRTQVSMHPGDRHHVHLSTEQVPDGAWDFMHNHPSQFPPSVGDVGWLNSAKSVMSVHVVDSSGGVFAISLPKRTAKDRGQWNNEAFHDVISQAHFAMDTDDGGDIFDEEVRRLSPESSQVASTVTPSTMDPKECAAMMLFFKAHARNLAFAKAGLINYDYELSDTQKNWMGTYKDSFDRYDRIGLKRVKDAMSDHDLRWQTEEEEFNATARVFRKGEGGEWKQVPAEEETPLVAEKDLEEAGINVEEKELVRQSWKQLRVKAKKFKQLATAGLEGLTTIRGINEHKIAVNSILAGGTEFDFDADTRSKDLHLGLIQMTPGHQGFGEGKKLLGGLVELAEGVGMKQISLRANIDVGGYAWAKYGFVPTELGWEILKRNLVIDMPARPDEPKQAKEWDRVQKLVKSDDPHALWPIADSSYGKQLLLNSTWDGVLKFNDTRAMRRFTAYITKKPRARRASAPIQAAAA